MKLITENVSKNFIRVRADSNVLNAVSGVSLELLPGELTVLTGPSGSGKSTLINMLSGLLPPTEGRILLGDTDIYSLEDRELSLLRNKHFGVIPQGQSALHSLTVLDNVLAPYILYNRAKGTEYEAAEKRAMELLEKAGIDRLKNVMPKELSGGEIRRMAVCRAMIMEPEIILADEPTGDLDEENTAAVMGLLKSACNAGGSVFIVTHDRQVYGYADRRLEMKKGVISAESVY